MKFAIKEIILWPRDTELKPRRIEFKTAGVNVITGWSETGKSSIVAIIDYCLGSEKCSIPIGIIRENVSWYGVLVELEKDLLLLARRDPAEQQSTQDFFVQSLSEESLPDVITKNTSVPEVKAFFDSISRLSDLRLDPQSEGGYGGRASFRDLAAFNFQPQHIVANPNNLFYKSDTVEHREKLRRVMPLALGAIDNEYLAAQAELTSLEQEQRRLEREIDLLTESSRSWQNEAEGFVVRAVELGLLPRGTSPTSNWTIAHYVRTLEPITAADFSIGSIQIPEGGTEDSVEEIKGLNDAEEELSLELDTIRRRLYQVDTFLDKQSEYEMAIDQQSDRLSSVGWFLKRMKENVRISIAESEPDEVKRDIELILKYAESILTSQDELHGDGARLDKLREKMRLRTGDIERSLNELRTKRQIIEGEVESFQRSRQERDSLAIFVGRVQQLVKTFSDVDITGDRYGRLQKLKRTIASLKAKTNSEAMKKRLDAASESVSRQIHSNANALQLEHRDENVSLDLKELTLRFSPTSGRTDYLWEIGSGKNWVGYHIAALLALHRFFLSKIHSPVPSFLIIDQPSQVFFPEAEFFDKLTPGQILPLRASRDIMEVRRIFTLLHDQCAACPTLQVIVLEHATSTVWQGLDIHVAANWRHGTDYLIPQEWLDQ